LLCPMASPKVNRVFAGNLPFNTTDEELAELFSGAAKRKVDSANVVRHGTHSLGFGFVVFASADDADAAIKELDKKEFKTRVINVELAKGEPRKPKKKRTGSKSGETSSPAGRDRDRDRDSSERSERAPKKKTSTGTSTATKKKAPVKKRTPKPRPVSDEESGSGEDSKEEKKPKRAPREPRKKTRRPPAPKGPPSTTTIFVANLPYGVDDEAFGELFKELGLVEAHIARTKKGKSKGFGFATFKDEAGQQKAIEAVNVMEVGGRKLSANRSTSKKAEDEEEGDEEKPEPAPADDKKTTSTPSKEKASTPTPTKKATATPTDEKPKEKPKEPKADK